MPPRIGTFSAPLVTHAETVAVNSVIGPPNCTRLLSFDPDRVIVIPSLESSWTNPQSEHRDGLSRVTEKCPTYGPTVTSRTVPSSGVGKADAGPIKPRLNTPTLHRPSNALFIKILRC